ncbi:MAG: hypothetical protein AAF125_23340, partial [Chloroflexota bacterium]
LWQRLAMILMPTTINGKSLPQSLQNLLHAMLYSEDHFHAGDAIFVLTALGDDTVRDEIRVIAAYDPDKSGWHPHVIEMAQRELARYDES